MIWRHEQSHLANWRGESIPNGLEFSYRKSNRPVEVYYPPMIAQIIGWWVNNKWKPWKWACRLGFLYDTPTSHGIYLKMKWRWDFWNGNRSYWAVDYMAIHGYDAYKLRYPLV